MKRVTLQLMLFLMLPFACESPKKNSFSGRSPGQELVLKYVDSGWNSSDIPALRELLSDKYVRNLNGIQVVKGSVELEAYIQNYRRAFPDLVITVNRWMESDEKVVAEWTFEGTNTGEFGEYVPTGKKARVSGVSIFLLNGENKIDREDTYYNELYLLQQLGFSLIPPKLE